MCSLTGLYILDRDALDAVYGPEEREAIDRHVRIAAPAMTRACVKRDASVLEEVDVLFSGWGGPRLDETFLDRAPRLKAVFYAAGSVSGVVTPQAWERGVVITSAALANAVPVAEYTLAALLFSLRHGWHHMRQVREVKHFPPRDGAPGSYGSTIGLISMGMTARELVRLLRPFDLKVLTYDPYLTESDARQLGVERVSLSALFERSDVCSLHSPLLPETVGLIGREHFTAMKPGATFINTARGQIVREREMIEVAHNRPDLQFVLDVTDPEPPEPGCPLYSLPNVVLTPHIAGSLGGERRRLGRYMVEELQRYVADEPLRWVVTPEMALDSSHRPKNLSRQAFRLALAASQPAGFQAYGPVGEASVSARPAST